MYTASPSQNVNLGEQIDMSLKTSRKPSSTRRYREATVVIAPAARDISSTESVLREWVVPLLVRDFLAEHRCLAETEANCAKRTFRPVGMEDVADGHIN
jgi:hypothetical protein